MSIDQNTVKRMASLSRLDIKETEIEYFAQSLNKVIAMVDQLQEVNIENIAPMASVAPMTQPMRQDKITDGEKQNEILANAPLSREGFFAVPKVVE